MERLCNFWGWGLSQVAWITSQSIVVSLIYQMFPVRTLDCWPTKAGRWRLLCCRVPPQDIYSPFLLFSLWGYLPNAYLPTDTYPSGKYPIRNLFTGDIPIGFLSCRTNGWSEKWVVGQVGCCTSWLSDKWVVGQVGVRKSGLSENWRFSHQGIIRRFSLYLCLKCRK